MNKKREIYSGSYLLLTPGILQSMIIHGSQKEGSIRLMAKKVDIPKTSLYAYMNEERSIPFEKLNRICLYLDQPFPQKHIRKILSSNWRQREGGQKCVLLKKENGSYETQLHSCQVKGIQKLKKWHKEFKERSPELYYDFLAENLRKAGGYKLITHKGELVRNSLEKDVADYLFSQNISYQYEPKIIIDGHIFFPDFFIPSQNLIIECTMWRGSEKAFELNQKRLLLEKKYIFIVIIPKSLYRYYETLGSCLIRGIEEFVPVAQTFQEDLRGATVEHI